MTRTLLLLLAIFGLNAGETGLPKPGTLDGVGVNIHFTHAEPGELEMLAAGGFRFVRMNFFWTAIEMRKGVYDFSHFDHLMADLDRVGLRAYFILGYANRLYDGGRSPHTDEGRAAFCAFVKAAMQRFAGRGIIWEMWNEPNRGMFWTPQPKVDDYVKLALAVGETVREVAPKEILVGPATSEMDLPFLEACFTGGCLSLWDAVSVHPYQHSPPESAAEDSRTLRQLITRHAPRPFVQDPNGPRDLAGFFQGDPKRLPILSGNWGFKHVGFDEHQQGRYLPRQWLSNIAQGVPISIWYEWHDFGDGRSNPELNFGTVRKPYRAGQVEVYEPKPAYVAAKTLTTVLKGYEFSKTLALKPDEHVLLFAKGDQLRLAAWTTAGEPRTVLVPASPGRFRVIGHLGGETPELIADTNGLTVTLTGEVKYLAPIDANPSLRLAVAWERVPLEIMLTAPQPGDLVRTEDPVNNRVTLAPPSSMHEAVTRFTNPLERAVLVGMEGVAPGMTCWAKQSIPIGERAAILPPVIWPLQVDGAVVWSQAVRLAFTNPVDLQVMPPFTSGAGLFLPVRVDNLLGTQFRADFVIPGREPLVGTRRTIEAGQQPVIVLPLSGRPDARFTAAVEARDPNTRRIIRSLPVRTYQPLTMGIDAWSVHPDGADHIGSTQTISASRAVVADPLAPQSTIDLGYVLEEGWKFLRVVPKAPLDLGAAREIGMWVHGDGSGNIVRLRLTDASDQTFQPEGGRLTFTGWKWLTFAIGPHTAHWGGANDGVVKPPLKLDTLFLLDQADRSKPSKGTVRIAGAMAVE